MHRPGRKLFFRWFFYLLGCVLLSAGITLNTKTALGVSPLVSVSYCVSQLTGFTFALMTFFLYSIFCLLQFPVRGKHCRWSDLLQIPFSLVFSWLLNQFSVYIPVFTTIPGRSIGLILAILFSGAGITLMVSMEIIANPADSLVAAIAVASGKRMGLIKNLLDGTCVLITCILSLVFAQRIIGVGIGTLCTVLFTGRVVAFCNHFFRAPMRRLAGFTDTSEI